VTGSAGGERTRLRILVVDDDPTMVGLVRQILRAAGFPDPAHVSTGAEAIPAAQAADVVLLDHYLPDTSGLDLIASLRAGSNPPAVVLFTAHGSESLAARALRPGADDYLAKDASLPELLPQVLERVRRTRALRDALAVAERDLVRAERLAAVGEMTVTLHHEINNPLMAAMAELELLLADSAGAGDRTRRGLEQVQRALVRIRDVVRRIRDLGEAPSTSYLGDLRMIDIAVGGGVRAARRGVALLHLADDGLARVAEQRLRGAGFRAHRAGSVDHLARAAEDLDVTLVLVGGTGAAGVDPLGGFRPPVSRRYRVVALVDGDPRPARGAGADHVIAMPFDPETLVGEILAVL
jgi:DNA-binding response OmpR family regulator